MMVLFLRNGSRWALARPPVGPTLGVTGDGLWKGLLAAVAAIPISGCDVGIMAPVKGVARERAATIVTDLVEDGAEKPNVSLFEELTGSPDLGLARLTDLRD